VSNFCKIYNNNNNLNCLVHYLCASTTAMHPVTERRQEHKRKYIQYIPQTSSIYHKHPVYTTNIQYIPQTSSIYHKSPVYTTNIQYIPQKSSIYHKHPVYNTNLNTQKTDIKNRSLKATDKRNNNIIVRIKTLREKCGSGQRSRSSNWLRTGRSGDRTPMEARFSAPVQSGPAPRPPAQPPVQWVTGISPGDKAAGVWSCPPTPI